MGFPSFLKGVFSSPTQSAPSPERLQAMLNKHVAMMKEAGATGDPLDYARDLLYLAPKPSSPLERGTMVCLCCFGLFYLDQFAHGVWGSISKKTGMPLPMCAYCLEWIDRSYAAQQGKHVLNVSEHYDEIGHQLLARFPEGPPTKAAFIRLATIEARKGPMK